MTAAAHPLLPRVLLVDTDPRSPRLAALTNAGFPVLRVDDVRTVRSADTRFRADVVVHLASHFAPSARSAFDTTLAQARCPVIVIDDSEARGLEFVRAGAVDLLVLDDAGQYLSQLMPRIRIAAARTVQVSAADAVSAPIAELIGCLPYGALLATTHGTLLMANPTAERIVGVTADQGRPWFAQLDPTLDIASRMRGSQSLQIATACFAAGPADTLRVELLARRLPGSVAPDGQWLVLLRELGADELDVRRQLEAERARRLVEYGGDILLLHDTEGRIVDVNHQATVQTGYTRDELLNLRIWDLDRDARPGAGIWTRLASGGALTVEGNILRKDGSLFPVEVKLGAWEDGRGKQIVAWLRDITERRQAEEMQRLAAIVFGSVSEGIMVADGEHRIVAVNPAFTSITEFSAEEAIGRDDAFLFAPEQHDSAFCAHIRSVIAEQGRWEGEVWSRARSGRVFPEWLSISAVRSHDGQIDRIVSVFTNITERKRLEEMMQRQAFHDPLTGLANRLLFHQRLKAALQAADERKNHVALLYIDLDHFKPVNDQHGHQVGDLVLKQVAERLLACGRHTDTVARLGGDEFAMILPDIDHAEAATQMPMRVIAALKLPLELDGLVVTVSASIGITLYPDHCRSIEQLLRFADQAMYKAKENRSEFRVFDATMARADD